MSNSGMLRQLARLSSSPCSYTTAGRYRSSASLPATSPTIPADISACPMKIKGEFGSSPAKSSCASSSAARVCLCRSWFRAVNSSARCIAPSSSSSSSSSKASRACASRPAAFSLGPNA